MVLSLQTSLCRLLHLDLPIIQAPMSRLTTPALVATVSQAGGLGMLGMATRDKEDVRQVLHNTRRLTDRPFGVNCLVRRQVDIAALDAQRDMCLDAGVPVVSFFWDDPAPYIARVHAAGSLVMYTVPSAAHARRAVDAGVDIIVAQGWEAGGHVQGEVATLPLVPRVVDAVTPPPVVAAGGIADGRGLVAALALGASGVWMGTRFLASAEATAHPVHQERLLQASETDTVYTGLFDIGGPGAPHRALRHSTITAWAAAGRPPRGQRPGEGEVIGHSAEGRPIVRDRSLTPLVGTTGNIAAMSLYTGQSVGLVTQSQAAGDLVRVVAAEALRVLRDWAALVQTAATGS